MITTETFLPLPNGDTYVRIDAPSAHISTDGIEHNDHASSVSTMLLVHGATVPQSQFDRIVPELFAQSQAAANRIGRIIRMDLYGHGKSARPRNLRHDISLFIQQVLGVIQHFKLDNDGQDLIALGHSLGAAVLVGVASSYPRGIFQRLILSAPMLDFMALNPHVKILTIPCIGELVMKFVLDPFLRQRRKKRNNITCKKKLKECFDGTSLLHMFRDRALGDQSMLYQRFGEMLRSNMDYQHTRILVIWGSHDKVVNGHHISTIVDMLNPLDGRLELERLEGLEHNQLSSDPHRCAKAILSRMTGNPSII